MGKLILGTPYNKLRILKKKYEQGNIVDLENQNFNSLYDKVKAVINTYKEKPAYAVTEHSENHTQEVESLTFEDMSNDKAYDYANDYDMDIIQIEKLLPIDFDADKLTDDFFDISYIDIDDEIEDYTIDEIRQEVEELLLTTNVLEYDIDDIVDSFSYADERKNAEEKEEEEYQQYIQDSIKKFVEQYKDYIQTDEYAGYFNSSYYAYLLMDKNGNLVKNNPVMFSRENKEYKTDYFNDNTLTIEKRNYIHREYTNKDSSNVVILVRISDHKQNISNINEIVDAGISIAISKDCLSPYSEEVYNNRTRGQDVCSKQIKCIGNEVRDEIDECLFQEMMIKFDDNENDAFWEIKHFIENLDYQTIIENRIND